MYENNIALFICQIQYLLYNEIKPNYDQSFVNSINAFITLYHDEYKESFKLLYLPNLIQELIDDEFLPLPEEYIIKILLKYQEPKEYLQLIDSIIEEELTEITNLVYKFMNFLEEAAKLYNAPINQYTKVLQ